MSNAQKSRYAIILGASDWPNDRELTPSDAFRNSAQAFKKYLTMEAGLAVEDDRILDLFDDPSPPTQIDEKISNFLTSINGAAKSELIIYYTGHGGFPKRENSYCLALRTSKRSTIGASGYRVTDLASTLLQDAPRARRLLFIDACYAARAANDFIPQSGIRDKIQRELRQALPDNGTALFCAASPVHDALAKPGDPYTMFTGALLDALRDGASDLPQLLSLNDLQTLVWDNIRSRHPRDAVQPEVHAPDQRKGNIAAAPIFPNPAFGILVDEIATPSAAVGTDIGRSNDLEDRSRWASPKNIALSSAIIILIGFASLGGYSTWKALGVGDFGWSQATNNVPSSTERPDAAGRAAAPGSLPPKDASTSGLKPHQIDTSSSASATIQTVSIESQVEPSPAATGAPVASAARTSVVQPIDPKPAEIAKLQPTKPEVSAAPKQLTGGILTYDSIYGKSVNPFDGGKWWSNAQGGHSWLQYTYPEPVAVGRIAIEMAGTDITSAGSSITVSVKEGSTWRTVYTLKDKVINRGFSGGVTGPQVGPQTIDVNGTAVSAVKVDMTGHGWFAASDIQVLSP